MADFHLVVGTPGYGLCHHLQNIIGGLEIVLNMNESFWCQTMKLLNSLH